MHVLLKYGDNVQTHKYRLAQNAARCTMKRVRPNGQKKYGNDGDKHGKVLYIFFKSKQNGIKHTEREIQYPVTIDVNSPAQRSNNANLQKRFAKLS